MAANASEATIAALEYNVRQSKNTVVIKDPVVPETYIKPRFLLNAVIGVILGLFFGMLYAFGAEWWKNGNEPKPSC